MTKGHHILYTLLGGLMMAACTADDPASDSTGSDAVRFSAVMDAKWLPTRAANAINDISTLDGAGGFGVFGCYTGLHDYVATTVHPDYMFNEHVRYLPTPGVWEYSPLKYWPNGEGETSPEIVTGANPHYVTFMAYAPWSDCDDTDPDANPAGYCIPATSLQGEVGNPWLTYRLHPDVTKQVDLLWAPPLLNQTKPDIGQRLLFRFQHALACVGENVTVLCNDATKTGLGTKPMTLVALTITYTLTEKGRLVLWNGGAAPNWQAIVSETPTTQRTVTLQAEEAAEPEPIIYSKSESIDELTYSDVGVFYIPMEVGTGPKYRQTAHVSIKYKVNGEVKTGETLLYLSDYPAAYQPGKWLNINIIIDSDGVYGYLVSSEHEAEQW